MQQYGNYYQQQAQQQQQQQQQQVANANYQKPEQYNSTAHYQASRLQQQQQQEDKLEGKIPRTMHHNVYVTGTAKWNYSLRFVLYFSPDPNPLIDVDLENETYFETHTALLNSLGAHWNFIDTFTSKVPDLLQP